ncbi:kinase non-catalytic C-lobe domain-containing protein 1-like isoform X3 [Mya arenaria]|uniref:kinase non-catalytic C-lobe domain-containing protein 1-like isoform X3 n=1 Tax=Mya arenaria TaxID=6604 RepID=UPI0022E4BC65|nr:kinase non-catalytic C-lobe domain-containing protein 1-like isoform X3 [Mya arenaria]
MDEGDIQGDETISLSDVLVARDSCLPEDELWALCRECCLVLEVVNNSPDSFQTLCVTPDTVAFDQVGNVCFLDLDVDPEPIYLPPEYSSSGNNYKAHLFSLGMTLLYAAEYNGDNTQEAVSQELREILGRMTADDPGNRPDLESTIILCEEQLCGQSSQEVCCGIAAVVGFGITAEDMIESLYWKGGNLNSICDLSVEGIENPASIHTKVYDETEATATATYQTDGSPEDYSHAESFIQSEQADATYCDDIPDLTDEISQAESLPLSEQETVIVLDTTISQDDSILSEEFEMEKQTKTKSRLKSDSTSDLSNVKPKPALPKKPDLTVTSGHTSEESASTTQNSSSKTNGELVVSELLSESDTSDQSRKEQEKRSSERKHKLSSSSSSDLNKSDPKPKERKSSSSSKKELQKDNNQNITFLKYGDSGNKTQTTGDSEVATDINSNGLDKNENAEPASGKKRNRRKQGLTITDILDCLDRSLREEELWALCKEGTAALQRKKKHLPAYLSPDTLVIRESGNLSFKAIPEEKPLEVIFMAPELQERGELTDKTCLFGLSVTLRCAAGKKYGPVSTLNITRDLKDLLMYLADPNPAKRPELVDVAKACNEHSNGQSSDSVCAQIFQDAYTALGEKENRSQKAQKEETPAPASVCTPSAFKPAGGSSFQPIKPTAVGSNSSAFSSTGAFCPIPKKPEPKKEVGEPRIPSAFSSPATHFKPIILQQTSGSTNEMASNNQESKSGKVKETDKTSASKPSSAANSQKKPTAVSPDQSNDKEKEVVKKLKELKKNLMKHKQQPSMAKEIENEDAVTETSTPSKKSLPAIPKKSSSSKSSEKSSKRRQSSGALEALLKEIQKQGNVPDTNSLASAIAGVLKSHLHQGDSATKPHITNASDNQGKSTQELDMSVTSAQASLAQGQMLQNLNIPQQYHSQLVGQTMSLPMQHYGGNMITGLPQFQFQQDPVTGFLQLVPVGVVPMRPQSVHSNSGSMHSAPDLASPTGSGTMMKDITSPDMSPKVYHNQSDASNSSAIGDGSGTRVKVPHGRTAKDLVQKTANLRAKNVGRPSPSNLLGSPQQSNGGLSKWRSEHTLENKTEALFYSDSERAKHASYSSLSFNNKLSAGFVYDDSMVHQGSYRHPAIPRPQSQYGQPHYRSPDDRHPLNSTTSSPSPSTHDSGIGGMNHGMYRGIGPGADISLMERLLSNVNVKQQKVLGKIVHLLREEFAFDGYMENGVEDLAMAEYILSLGMLKWETFKSAISEKYSDLYFHDTLLNNLYASVNSNRPVSVNRNSSGGQSRVPVSQKSSRHNRQAGHRDDDSSSLSETNEGPREATHNRLQPNLSPMGGQNMKPRHNDTSDSTDSETYSKRRRIKTKHELDKMKSSSNSNLLSENIVGEQTVVSASQPSEGAIVPNGNIETKPPKVPGSFNNVSTTNLPSNKTVVPNVDVNQSKSSVNSNSSQVVTSLNGSLGFPLVNNSNQGLTQVNSNQGPPPVNSNQGPRVKNCTSHLQQLSVNGTTSPQKVEAKDTGSNRPISVSSHSSGQSDLDKEVTEGIAVERKGHVVYHWAMIHLSMSQEMEKFMHEIDEQDGKMLQQRLGTLEQQLKMERRMRKKTQKFYKGRIEANKTLLEMNKTDKTAKGERNQILQVAKDITEMTKRINFIDLCKTHIQMLLAELQGIDVSYLHSIAVCPLGEPLQLQPRPDNPLLQFQTLREPHSGCEIQALHAGSPEGLMAYLFASTALSDGYIHQFLFCYRYFTTAADVLDFLITKYVSASKSGSTEVNISRLQQRVVDLLHYWMEGYFSVDFRGRPGLISSLRDFVKEHIQEESEGGQGLLALLSNCCSGNHLELSSSDPDEADMHFWQRSEKQKQMLGEKKKELYEDSTELKSWDSFRSLVRGKTTGKEKSGKVKISAVVVERRRKSNEGSFVPMKPISRRTDMFVLADYSAQCLAEQLCLIEQSIFQQTHPVHYLDSKSQGVGVALTMKPTRTPAVARRSCAEESFGLFVDPLRDTAPIQRLIDHAQDVTHWVATEIVACSNPKMQIAILSKFLFIGHACMELRNFATSMAILDGLENLIVKQLPAWKHLPAKCSSLIEELSAKRMFLKNDPLSLMQQGKECHLYPTIPSTVFFLLHIQQQEIGGFKLANQMFKWSKMRTICQVIDQVRVYREHMYGFDPDTALQDTLRQRIQEMTTHDVQDLASQYDINYHKLSSGSGISGALKKMKGKFQAK